MSAMPAHIGPTARRALDLLAMCPQMPTEIVHVIVGAGHPGSTRQLLARLAAAQRVRAERWTPPRATRPVRLWTPNAASSPPEQTAATASLTFRQARLANRQLVAAYPTTRGLAQSFPGLG